jgi:hypothetical protein
MIKALLLKNELLKLPNNFSMSNKSNRRLDNKTKLWLMLAVAIKFDQSVAW